MRGRSGWKAYVLTLLCLMTVTTLSLVSGSMAKYIATGNSPSSPQVAKWDVKFGTAPTGQTGARPDSLNCYLRPYTGQTNLKANGDATKYIWIINDSQVAAKLTTRLAYTTTINYPGSSVTDYWPVAAGLLTLDAGRSDKIITGTASGTNNGNQEVTIGPKGRVCYSFNVLGGTNGVNLPAADVSGTPSSGNNETYSLRVYVNAEQVD